MSTFNPSVRLSRLSNVGIASAFRAGLAIAALALLPCLPTASAQISTVVFQDDFASNAIDPAKYSPDAPFFEGGKGDIHAEARNGVVEFVGTTTTQWWSGGTLQIAPTFNASEAAPVSISLDRVAEAGQGTASRSALWILDESKTKYVLFADVRGGAAGGTTGRSARMAMCLRAAERTSPDSMAPLMTTVGCTR